MEEFTEVYRLFDKTHRSFVAMNERILLIGSGGREHALAKSLKSSPSCERLWCAPGNPGIAQEAEIVALNVGDHDAVARWCVQNNVSLVVIGPEQPLAAGLSDDLRNEGIDVFGPSKAAAQLETSKGFSKDFMLKHSIPTAPYKRFESNQHAEARTYCEEHDLPVVIKYDGLAAGKGVIVAETRDDALKGIDEMYDGAFGNDGVVVEGFLKGQEASVFVVSDGTDYVVLAPAQDHKRIGEGDTGKNTGGMGAYAPAPIVTPLVMEQIEHEIIEPTLRGMREEDAPFVGCLFCGLMINEGKPSVVEFNARFGDPETQVVLAILNADTAALFASAARGQIDISTVSSIQIGHACNVVLASAGYPEAYEKGKSISGIGDAESDAMVSIMHAGTSEHDDGLVTSGGRVLGVVGTDDTLSGAIKRSYKAVESISFAGKTYRRDIGHHALGNEIEEKQ